jgi:hypothetical protein
MAKKSYSYKLVDLITEGLNEVTLSQLRYIKTKAFAGEIQGIGSFDCLPAFELSSDRVLIIGNDFIALMKISEEKT